MNIKIITCHYAYNYGAVLQTYALCKYLNENNCHAEIINYRPWYYKGSTKTTNKVKLMARKIIRIPDNIKSEQVFCGFLNKYVPMTFKIKSYDELKKIDFISDVFITGSDQVWNFNLPNGKDDAFYLGFVNKGKKVSYAASLGMDDITSNQKSYLKERLNDFDRISVRENTAKELLQDAGITNVHVVMDPVYLLEKTSWLKMMKRPTYVPGEKYIMVFAFNRQKEIFDFGRRLAQKYGYKVISVNTFWEDVFNKMDHYYWNCLPEEFLYLINRAECIITNSFHGLSFSMILNKPVILFQKDDKGNSRMMDLIKILGAHEALNKEHKKNLTIPVYDFEGINSRIQKGSVLSRDFLKNIICE